MFTSFVSIFFVMSLGSDGSVAPSHLGLNLDGSPVPLSSTATHEPTWISKYAWTRWKPLDATTNEDKTIGMNT